MLVVDVQNASLAPLQSIPSEGNFRHWATSALGRRVHEDDLELTIRIVDEAEGAALNQQFRAGTTATNVLSFCADVPEVIKLELQPLGDLVICAPVVEREAQQQQKESKAHWAHMLVHGVLHLIGFDHLHDNEAEEMEALEIEILQQLGFNNPYLDQIAIHV